MTAAPRAAVFANLTVDLGTPLAQEDQLLLQPSPCGRPAQLLRADLGTSFVGSWYSSAARGAGRLVQAWDQAKEMSSGKSAVWQRSGGFRRRG
jgi:hypothetical protein